jgi:hypothetical protein
MDLNAADFQDLLLQDTEFQYHSFGVLEHYLFAPLQLQEQSMIVIPINIQLRLIELYYTFDENVMRELLGKKLSRGTRKDLDDVAVLCGVSLVSCQRQFDNLRRIYRFVEDKYENPKEMISQEFLMNAELSQRYVKILFFCENRFDVPRKKFQALTFRMLEDISGILLENWTSKLKDTPSLEIDNKFGNELRDVRNALLSQKDSMEPFRNQVLETFRSRYNHRNSLGPKNMTATLKTVLTLASSLLQTKDFRDLFWDALEKLVEPLIKMGLTTDGVAVLMTSIADSFPSDASDFRKDCWKRFCTGLSSILFALANVM